MAKMQRYVDQNVPFLQGKNADVRANFCFHQTPPPPDPEWNDLSPRLQVEIIENLLQNHSWGRIMALLGLTIEDCRKVQEHLHSRNRQIEYENAQLKEMREKQLRALMRIDNSQLRLNRVPHQLVFRKTSRQYSRKLRESIKSDYLLCQAGEVLGARRFLHKCGLDPHYAGDWSNEMVVLRKSRDQDVEKFEWKDEPEPDPQRPDGSPEENGTGENIPSTGQVDISSTVQINHDPLQTRVRFINEVGTAGTVDPADLRVRIGDLSTPPRQSSTTGRRPGKAVDQPTPRHTGIVRLKIGSERAARIRNSGDFAEYAEMPAFDVSQPETRQGTRQETGQLDGSSRTAVSPSPVIPQKRPTAGLFQQPVRRIMGGQWSYDSLERNPNSATSSKRLRERLEEARVEAQAAIAGTEASQVNSVKTAVRYSKGVQSNSLSGELPIRTSPQQTPYQGPSSTREEFHRPVPELAARAEASTLTVPERKNETKGRSGVAPIPSSQERTPMPNIPDLAGHPECGPAYSPITPPLGQSLFQESKSEREQRPPIPSIVISEFRPMEDSQRKTDPADEKESKAVKTIAEEKRENYQKCGRDETSEIKDSLANVPLHSEAIDSDTAEISRASAEAGHEQTEQQQTTDVTESLSNHAAETPQASIKIVIRQGKKQQRRSDPGSQVNAPEQNVSTPQPQTPQLGPDHTVPGSSGRKTCPIKAKSARSSTPGASTRQKASAKKTPSTEPTRRSERLNGPPNQRVLRKRN